MGHIFMMRQGGRKIMGDKGTIREKEKKMIKTRELKVV
jgi:hypothetical protein